MKSHLIFTSTENMTDADWHYFRFVNGLGASEIGCVLGLTASWKSPIELFYQKLDPAFGMKKENLRMHFGNRVEDIIADEWQYWEGTEQSLIDNYNAGRIVRRCQRVNGFIQNPKYPQLFVSLDRKINKNTNGEEGVLELKLISREVENMYEHGIPGSHMAQVEDQLLVTELNYGELGVSVDFHRFNVYEFKADQELFDTIIPMTEDFWKRVKQGRIIMTQIHEATMNHNMKLKQKLEGELAALEPALIGGEAENMFLKEKFRKTLDQSIGTIKGTEEDLKTARNLKDLKDKIKALEGDASVFENMLKRRLGESVILDFGKDGKVSWQGNPRRFSNQVKL